MHSFNKKVTVTTIAASLGNMMEFYNFTLFSLFLPVLIPVFFPLTDQFASLLSGYLVLAVGFFGYPFGSLFFGYIGDKYGRKSALLISISLMSIATSLIGILPSFEQAGVFSPLALSACRIIQGACAGGEAIGAGILVAEHTKMYPNKFLLGSIPAAFGTLGALFASIISYFFIKNNLIADWWRIPFLSTLLLGLIGFYFRHTMTESPLFRRRRLDTKRNLSAWKIFKVTPLSLIAAVAVGALGTVPFYLTIGFINNYLVNLRIAMPAEAAIINMILLFFCAFTLPLAGYLADKVGYYYTMLFSIIAALIYAYPFFWLLFNASLPLIVVAELLFLSISQLYVAPINVFISQLFPSHLRYKGAALGYCLGMALFGGTAPYFSTLLIKWSGNNLMPISYLIFVILVGMTGLVLGIRSRNAL